MSTVQGRRTAGGLAPDDAARMRANFLAERARLDDDRQRRAETVAAAIAGLVLVGLAVIFTSLAFAVAAGAIWLVARIGESL